MPDNAEAIESLWNELEIIRCKSRKSGLTHGQIVDVLIDKVCEIYMRMDIEDSIKRNEDEH